MLTQSEAMLTQLDALKAEPPSRRSPLSTLTQLEATHAEHRVLLPGCCSSLCSPPRSSHHCTDASTQLPYHTAAAATASHRSALRRAAAVTPALRSAAELPSRSVPPSRTSSHCRAAESGGAADAAEDKPEASRWWRRRSTLARHWELTANETTATMEMLWLS